MPGAPPPWPWEEPGPPSSPAQEFPSCPILHGRTSRMETVYIRPSFQQERPREVILRNAMVTELFPVECHEHRDCGYELTVSPFRRDPSCTHGSITRRSR